MTSETSPSLLLKIRDPQNQDAWNRFVDIYAPIVRTYCFQRRIQEADVNDIVQDVMTTVAKAIREFDYDPTKGRFRAWFGTIAANQIKDFVHKDARENNTVGTTDPVSMAATYIDPDSDWVAIFSQRVFNAACEKIKASVNEVTWASFEATWIKNESAADVAKSLGIPIQSVYVNKSRVLKSLEEEVKMLADDLPFHEGSHRNDDKK